MFPFTVPLLASSRERGTGPPREREMQMASGTRRHLRRRSCSRFFGVLSLFPFSVYNREEREGLSARADFGEADASVCVHGGCCCMGSRIGLARHSCFGGCELRAETCFFFAEFIVRTDPRRHAVKDSLPPSPHPAHRVGQTHAAPCPQCG